MFHLIAVQPIALETYSAPEWQFLENISKKAFVKTTKIDFPEFPHAFNPSLLKVEEGILLSFRFMPDTQQPWLSYIGLALLDDQYNIIHEPYLLQTRAKGEKTPSQAEDARLFSYNNKIYLVYNDNVDIFAPTAKERRDIYIAELTRQGKEFFMEKPVKMFHSKKYDKQLWQKNWVPFEWDGELLITYTINPHEILLPDLKTGFCTSIYETHKNIKWDLGVLRGSSPPILLDGEYFAFFHSGIQTTSPFSRGEKMWHYFMGAYTFSSSPPFSLQKITSFSLTAPGLYTHSNYCKRVIFPGGAYADEKYIYMAYGKDDSEMWIAQLERAELKKLMWPIK